MRLSMIGLVLALGAPVSAQELRVPDRFLGHWETNAGNCSVDEPTEGLVVEINRHDDMDRIQFWDWSTEGGSCEIVMTQPTLLPLPMTTIFANCGFEDNDKEADEFDVVLISPARLAFWGDIYHRCDH